MVGAHRVSMRDGRVDELEAAAAAVEEKHRKGGVHESKTYAHYDDECARPELGRYSLPLNAAAHITRNEYTHQASMYWYMS